MHRLCMKSGFHKITGDDSRNEKIIQSSTRYFGDSQLGNAKFSPALNP